MKLAIILSLLILVFVVACAPAIQEEALELSETNDIEVTGTTEDEAIVESEPTDVEVTEDEQETVEAAVEDTSSAVLLAGSESKYYEFDKVAYEQAKADNKNIFLYFYATWCPSCRAEQRFVHGAFDDLNDPNTVGFRVNYRDTDTDDDEQALAKEFNVVAQSTKVLISNGEVIEKTPKHFTAEDYVGFLDFN